MTSSVGLVHPSKGKLEILGIINLWQILLGKSFWGVDQAMKSICLLPYKASHPLKSRLLTTRFPWVGEASPILEMMSFDISVLWDRTESGRARHGASIQCGGGHEAGHISEFRGVCSRLVGRLGSLRRATSKQSAEVGAHLN